jgi:nitrite reductase (NADH) large subunit
MTNYLIIGNGVAGTTAAEHIRKLDKEGDITIISDEDVPFYYRLRLNEYLAGKLDENGLMANEKQWYKDQDIHLKLGVRVVSVEAVKKFVETEDKDRLFFDRLLVATGSHSFIPPIKNVENKGVFALRSMQDSRDISAWAKNIEEVVLIGGGLLGLEAGHALISLGKKVTVVEFFPRLLPRQLDEAGAKMLQGILEEMGFVFRLGARIQEIAGDEQAAGVLLEGGEALPAGMVIVSAGVRPNLEIAEDLGLDFEQGIKVDEQMRTNQPHIFAAGDVVEFKGMSYGIWPAAMAQGKIAGINMAGGEMVYDGTTMANTLKVAGVVLASAGEIDAENKFEFRVMQDNKVYKKIVIKNNRIIGCIMLGNKKGFNDITKAMSEKQDVSKNKDMILTA